MKIENSKYAGYLWYSNKTEPEILDGDKDFELDIDERQNPFIIEGQLWDGDKSVGIKYVDGKYLVKEFYPASLEGEVQELKFASNRMDGRILKFRQFWRDEPDDMCEGMNVLMPKEMVFVGFDK